MKRRGFFGAIAAAVVAPIAARVAKADEPVRCVDPSGSGRLPVWKGIPNEELTPKYMILKTTEMIPAGKLCLAKAVKKPETTWRMYEVEQLEL
jgi:hypothetical protein